MHVVVYARPAHFSHLVGGLRAPPTSLRAGASAYHRSQACEFRRQTKEMLNIPQKLLESSRPPWCAKPDTVHKVLAMPFLAFARSAQRPSSNRPTALWLTTVGASFEESCDARTTRVVVKVYAAHRSTAFKSRECS